MIFGFGFEKNRDFAFDWMVQLMRSGNLRQESERTAVGDKPPVKLEIVEDSLEEEHGPLNKRSKPSSNLQQVSILFPFVYFNAIEHLFIFLGERSSLFMEREEFYIGDLKF